MIIHIFLIIFIYSWIFKGKKKQLSMQIHVMGVFCIINYKFKKKKYTFNCISIHIHDCETPKFVTLEKVE